MLGDSAYRLVCTMLNLVIKPKVCSSNVPISRKLNVSHLRVKLVCKKLEEYLDKADSENIWPAFKEYIYSISSEVLGFVEWSGNLEIGSMKMMQRFCK